jgi:hypothetical protein
LPGFEGDLIAAPAENLVHAASCLDEVVSRQTGLLNRELKFAAGRLAETPQSGT